MKKISFAAICFAILLIASCKKNNTSSALGHWSFGTEQYNVSDASFSPSDSSLNATADGGKLSVYFPSAAVSAGSYLIVNYDSVPLHAGQIYIRFIDNATSQYYFSTGDDAVSANVALSSSGKIKLSIPAVYLESYFNPTPYTAQLTATINAQ